MPYHHRGGGMFQHKHTFGTEAYWAIVCLGWITYPAVTEPIIHCSCHSVYCGLGLPNLFSLWLFWFCLLSSEKDRILSALPQLCCLVLSRQPSGGKGTMGALGVKKNSKQPADSYAVIGEMSGNFCKGEGSCRGTDLFDNLIPYHYCQFLSECQRNKKRNSFVE